MQFEIIREMSDEFGESAQLFSDMDAYFSYISDLDYEWLPYPDSETATIFEVVEWLNSMNERGQNFILRNAVITDIERAAIEAALAG